MKNIEIKIVGGFFAILFLVVIIAFWRDGSKDVNREQVVIQQVIDSLTERHNAEIIAREDSIQKAAYSNIALLQAEKDKEAAKSKKLERKLSDLNKTVSELDAQYADQCGELIDTYRERHDTAMAIIKQKTVELKICNAEVNSYIAIARSQDVEITKLQNTITEKNKTITTQKDRLTTITNRMDRNFIYRNWMWITGRFRKRVLE